MLRYGREEALTPQELRQPGHLRAYVQATTRVQVDLGATAIVAPYFYATSPADPWFDITLTALCLTRGVADREAPGFPVLAVLCAQLRGFGPQPLWAEGVDRFVAAAGEAGVSGVGMLLSPVGAASDRIHRILPLFNVALRIRAAGLPTTAWRQGVYGPALVAAGLDGYEPGACESEHTDVAKMRRSRQRPAKAVEVRDACISSRSAAPSHDRQRRSSSESRGSVRPSCAIARDAVPL